MDLHTHTTHTTPHPASFYTGTTLAASLLEQAARGGFLDVLVFLLEHVLPADLDWEHDVALTQAVCHGHVDVARFLWEEVPGVEDVAPGEQLRRGIQGGDARNSVAERTRTSVAACEAARYLARQGGLVLSDVDVEALQRHAPRGMQEWVRTECAGRMRGLALLLLREGADQGRVVPCV